VDKVYWTLWGILNFEFWMWTYFFRSLHFFFNWLPPFLSLFPVKISVYLLPPFILHNSSLHRCFPSHPPHSPHSPLTPHSLRLSLSLPLASTPPQPTREGWKKGINRLPDLGPIWTLNEQRQMCSIYILCSK
jgi:hypothetical protein